MNRGLCFHSPFVGFDNDQPFTSFRDARIDKEMSYTGFRAATAENIHNPWPQLVDVDNRGVASTQPLIYGYYVPSTLPVRDVPLTTSDFSLPIRIARHHEVAHLTMNLTPAKDYARYQLAWAYDSLALELFQHYSHEEQTRQVNLIGILAANDELNHIQARILLAEELVATAFSFSGVVWLPDTSSYSNDLNRLMRDYIDSQVSSLNAASSGLGDAFARLYDTFLYIATLASSRREEDRFWMLALLGIFLEPVASQRKDYGEVPIAVDSLERCEELAIAVRSMSTYTDVFAWLSERNQDELDVHGWALANKFAFAMVDAGAYWKLLMELVLGKDGLQFAINLRDDAIRYGFASTPDELYRWLTRTWGKMYASHVADSTRNIADVFLFPEEKDGRWYVRPLLSQHGTEGHMAVVAMEALRQQIDSGIGIRCPYRQSKECVCAAETPEFRQFLLRLAELATQGVFGDGEWSAPPAPCGSGYNRFRRSLLASVRGLPQGMSSLWSRFPRS